MVERRKVPRPDRDKLTRLLEHSDRLIEVAEQLEQFSAEVRQRYEDEIYGRKTQDGRPSSA